VARIAIAINVVILGQGVSRRQHLKRVRDATPSSWLRRGHLWFVGLILIVCMLLIVLREPRWTGNEFLTQSRAQ
jgi:hypothetical protein